MNVVRGDHIVEHGQTEAFFCLENPVQITAPIAHSEEVESYRLTTKRLKRSEAVEPFDSLLCGCQVTNTRVLFFLLPLYVLRPKRDLLLCVARRPAVTLTCNAPL